MDSDASVRCNECWCGSCKIPPMYPRDSESVYMLLMSNALGIDTLVFIESMLYSIWMLFSLIQGFALYNGNPGAGTVSNIAWWAVIEFVVLQLGARATGFKLNLSADMSMLELAVASARKFLLFYVIMLCLAVVANIVHLSLLIAELVRGSGTLATTNPGFGWAFLALLIMLVIVDVFLAVRALVYRSNLNYANVLDDFGTRFALGRDKESSPQNDVAAAPSTDIANMPLLDRIQMQKKSSTRRTKAPLIVGTRTATGKLV